jgi:SAM-dependent methyltransferase
LVTGGLLEFTDCFSQQAKEYARYRPTYPPSLFQFLATCTPSHEWAWDCATGNGQAALGLVPYFNKVTATDPSQEQLNNAVAHPKITYQVATAERSGLPDRVLDLVTAATAAHWFELDQFYQEARRVLKPSGVIALWSYGFDDTVDSWEVKQVLDSYMEIVKPYFHQKIHRLWNGYKDLPFPFTEMAHPEFEMQIDWTFEQTMGYLLSWSGTHSYIKQKDSDPRELIREKLLAAWGDPSRPIRRTWKLGMRVGRNA